MRSGLGGALTLARKEARDILRERTILMALVTQLFVAGFSAFLAVGLVALYDPASVQAQPDLEVAYVGPGGFDAYLDAAEHVVVRRMPIEGALAAFGAGEVFAIAEETYGDPEGERTVSLLLPKGEFLTTLAVSELKTLLQDYERDLRLERADRLDQEVLLVASGARPDIFFAFAYSLLVPLLIATPVFLSGAITGDSLNDEITTRTLTLLRSTPMTVPGLVVGKLAAPVLLAPAQVALWFLLLEANGIPVANEPLLLLLTTALALFLSAASIIVAVLVRKEGQVQAAYTVMVLLLGVLSVLAPRDPFNVIARLAVGQVDLLTLAMLGLVIAGALFALAAALAVAERKLRDDVV